MPEQGVVSIPLSKGLIVDPDEVDWLDALPVNLLAVPKTVLESSGYLRSWPGLSLQFTTNDVARGAVNNVALNTIFRVQGAELVDVFGTVLTNVGGTGHAAMPYSSTTQGIVSANDLNYWDGTTLTQLQNWAEDEFGVGQPATTFDIGEVLDAVYENGRYHWIKRGSGEFGVTDLLNEQRPDYLAPFYSAESGFDENIGIAKWKKQIVVFGRFTTEFFRATGVTEPIYRPDNSLTVQAGIVGVGAKAEYYDNFAIVGGPENEPASVYLIGQGQYTELATRRVQKLIRSYTDEELAQTYIEPIKFDSHDIIIIHLLRDTLVYDHAASDDQNRRWTILKSDVSGTLPYRGIYHIARNNQFTAGDRRDGSVSNFDFTDARHVGELVEFECFSPMLQAFRNQSLFDFQVDSVPGYDEDAYRLAFSVTFDGKTYGQEKWIDFSKPNKRRDRILARRLGYIRDNVGFKLRWLTRKPSIVSHLRVRPVI